MITIVDIDDYEVHYDSTTLEIDKVIIGGLVFDEETMDTETFDRLSSHIKNYGT